MSETDITYQVILDSIGVKAFNMPEGYFPDVEIHCWGAGGGSAFNQPGGAGGYARATVNINPGDEVVLQIGQPGLSNGLGGVDNSYRILRGGNGVDGAGGGGASWVVVGDNMVCCAGGGGGAGSRGAGSPGGNTIKGLAKDSRGGDGIDGSVSNTIFTALVVIDPRTGSSDHGYYTRTAAPESTVQNVRQYIVRLNGATVWDSTSPPPNIYLPANYQGSVYGIAGPGGGDNLNAFNLIVNNEVIGGGGGGGFPKGGSTSSQGGGGGQNFGNLTIAGSGTIPGGTTTTYYPGNKKGEAGYPGYVLLILRKKFNAFIKNPDASGDWVRANTAYVKTPSQSVTVSQAVGPQTTTYNSVGTNTFTVPAGVTSIQLTVIGGGGGGGGADSSPGSAGRAGARVSGTLAVSPGQILTISVGSGGGGGTSDQGSAPGGVGGTNNLGYSGGSGSAAGPTPISGGGGGGGAASAVLVNGSPTVVAAGGGGGGGGGNGVPGQGVSPGGTSGGIAGSAGQTKSGDGGGAGGGGGGYPQGGRGGNVGGGDVGGFSGADGQSLVPAGFSLGQGGGGGLPAIRGSRASSGGGGGSVTLSYTPAPVNVTIVTGGWKQIQQAFTKVNSQWKPLLANEPIILNSYPTRRRVVTINVTVPTYDFVVYNALPIQYFEGLMDVNVYIAANTTIGSTDVTTPAVLVDQFATGDIIKITNYGTIAGRGGDGGAAGQYISSAVYTINYKGVSSYAGQRITSVPGRPGQFGGEGIKLDYPTVIENYGTIAGGGGGGGGGGGPTGGQGGGGAGAFPGNGGNNGTSTTGGAGLGLGGSGGARGIRGTNGTNDTNSGGLGGAPGAAVVNIQNATFTVTGTRIGPLT